LPELADKSVELLQIIDAGLADKPVGTVNAGKVTETLIRDVLARLVLIL